MNLLASRKIKIAFYKEWKGLNHWVNAVIAGWTWLPNINTPPYSHVEIGFEFEDGWWFYSSTMRDGANGTRWISEKELLRNRERWDVYETEQEDRSVVDMIGLANLLLGRKYDKLGLAGFATPFGLVNSKENWYCSEVCWYILTGKWKKRISPRRMYKLVRKLCGIKLLGS